MKGVDAADRAEVVSHLFAVEAIFGELRVTLRQRHVGGKDHDCTAHPAMSLRFFFADSMLVGKPR